MQSEQHWSFDPFFQDVISNQLRQFLPGVSTRKLSGIYTRFAYLRSTWFIETFQINERNHVRWSFCWADLQSNSTWTHGGKYLSKRTLLNLSIYPSFDLPRYRSIHLSFYPAIHFSFHSAIHASNYPSIYPSIRLSILLSVRLSIRLSIHSFIYLSIYLSIDSSLCPSIHPPNPMTVTMVIRKRHFRISFQLTETSLHIQKIHKQT